MKRSQIGIYPFYRLLFCMRFISFIYNKEETILPLILFSFLLFHVAFVSAYVQSILFPFLYVLLTLPSPPPFHFIINIIYFFIRILPYELIPILRSLFYSLRWTRFTSPLTNIWLTIRKKTVNITLYFLNNCML